MKKNHKLYRYATKEDIGARAIPADNSYCIKVSDNSEGWLANEEVVIETRPVKLKIRSSKANSRLIEREFVVVIYKGETYRVINCFHKIVRPGQPNWIGSMELAKTRPKHDDNSPYKYQFGDQDKTSIDYAFGRSLPSPFDESSKNNPKPAGGGSRKQ